MKKGYKLWNGITSEEYIIQGGSQETIAAKSYNSSQQANYNDEYLNLRMEMEYKVKKGDFNIRKITTKAGRGYGLDASGKYVNLKNGSSVGGYVQRFSTGTSNLHVSPYFTLANDIAFRSVAGHELIHAYHHYTIPNFNSIFSERVAYRYTYDTYMRVGLFKEALGVYRTAMPIGFWGSYPAQYKVPTPFGW